MRDRDDECGGDSPCWAHLFEDWAQPGGVRVGDPSAGSEPTDSDTELHATPNGRTLRSDDPQQQSNHSTDRRAAASVLNHPERR